MIDDCDVSFLVGRLPERLLIILNEPHPAWRYFTVRRKYALNNEDSSQRKKNDPSTAEAKTQNYSYKYKRSKTRSATDNERLS